MLINNSIKIYLSKYNVLLTDKFGIIFNRISK